MNMFTVIVHAPLGGVQKRYPQKMHAITLEAGLEALSKQRCAVTPCGVKVRFVVVRGEDGTENVAVWPPRAEGPFTRCRECWVATGKKRPRKDGRGFDVRALREVAS